MIGLNIRDKCANALSLLRWISQLRISATIALVASALIAGRNALSRDSVLAVREDW